MTPSQDNKSSALPAVSCETALPVESDDLVDQPKTKTRAKQLQDKANRIVMEAIAKAQAAGNVDMPKV